MTTAEARNREVRPRRIPMTSEVGSLQCVVRSSIGWPLLNQKSQEQNHAAGRHPATRLPPGLKSRAKFLILMCLTIVFGLFVGFTAAQVWSDSAGANVAVDREASALGTGLL